MDLDSALNAHADWKVKLRAAINARAKLDAESIARDNCCALGQWLHGEARRSLGDSQTLANAVKRHAEFHCEAGAVARRINAGQYDRADAMLDAGTPYANASMAVGSAIVRLKREVQSAA